MPICKCGKEFHKNHHRQIYCSRQCRDRFKMRRYYALRRKNGLCPQCGKPFDDANPLLLYRKRPPSYCRRCQEYFRQRYREMKQQKPS